jgi:hypothetical protein
MKKSVITKLLTELEQLVQTEFESAVEFWFARDLQGVLGYTKWDNFRKVVEGAMVACETSGHKASDHFPEVGKMIPLGKGGQRNERSSLDCGSLLPLSAKQPAASGSALARRSRTKPQSSAVDSRLSHGKLQQAVAVQSLRLPWTPDQFPGIRKMIPQFTFSTSHFSLTASHS